MTIDSHETLEPRPELSPEARALEALDLLRQAQEALELVNLHASAVAGLGFKLRPKAGETLRVGLYEKDEDRSIYDSPKFLQHIEFDRDRAFVATSANISTRSIIGEETPFVCFYAPWGESMYVELELHGGIDNIDIEPFDLDTLDAISES